MASRDPEEGEPILFGLTAASLLWFSWSGLQNWPKWKKRPKETQELQIPAQGFVCQRAVRSKSWRISPHFWTWPCSSFLPVGYHSWAQSNTLLPPQQVAFTSFQLLRPKTLKSSHLWLLVQCISKSCQLSLQIKTQNSTMAAATLDKLLSSPAWPVF